MNFYENLTNTTFSSVFCVHLPDWERDKGQRHSDVRYLKFIAVSAFYICNKFNKCFRIFPDRVLGYLYIFADKCRSVPTVAKFSDDRLPHMKPFLSAEHVRRVPFRHRLSS